MKALDVNEFEALMAGGHTIIDARSSDIFAEGFIEGSLSIPFDENFAGSVSELLGVENNCMLVAEEKLLGKILEVLAAEGLPNINVYLKNGFESWKGAEKKMDLIIAIDADEFAMDYQYDEFYLIDTRSKADFAREHVEDSENIALADLEQIITGLDEDHMYYIYGNSAKDAITAASIFKKNGIHRVRAVTADFVTIKASKIPVFVQKKGANTNPPFQAN